MDVGKSRYETAFAARSALCQYSPSSFPRVAAVISSARCSSSSSLAAAAVVYSARCADGRCSRQSQCHVEVTDVSTLARPPLFQSVSALVNAAIKLNKRLVFSQLLPVRARFVREHLVPAQSGRAQPVPVQPATVQSKLNLPEQQPLCPTKLDQVRKPFPQTLIFTGKQGTPVTPTLITSICQTATLAEEALKPPLAIRVAIQLSKTGVGICFCNDQLSYSFVSNILDSFSCYYSLKSPSTQSSVCQYGLHPKY
jgi:hypothetical protein